MAKYKITSPSGEVFEITAPEGASQKEILDYAKQRFAQIKQNPVKKPSNIESALRGAGMVSSGFSDSALEAVGAIPDLVAKGLRAAGLPSPNQPDYYTQNLKKFYKRLADTLAKPLQGVMPNLGQSTPKTTTEKALYGAGRGAGHAVSFLAPATAISKFAQSGSLPQRVATVMKTQPAVQVVSGGVGGGVADATDSQVAGLAASLLTPNVLNVGRKIISPSIDRSTPRQKIVDTAKKENIPLSPAAITGSQPLKSLEGVFANLPPTARTRGRLNKETRLAFNKAVMRTAGINADNAAPEVMQKAVKDFGKRFKSLINKSEITVDAKWFDEVEEVAKNYRRRLDTNVVPKFNSYVDDIMKVKKAYKRVNFPFGNRLPAKPGERIRPRGEIKLEGEVYQKITSDLRRAARQAHENPDLQFALNGLVNSVDDLLSRNVPKKLMSDWKNLREEYRNFTIIDKAMRGGSQTDRVESNIPFAALKNAVLQADRRGFSKGRGKLNPLSRVGDLIGSSRAPDSGTPMRQVWQAGMVGGPAAIAYGTSYDPLLTGASLAAGYFAPKMAQGAYRGAQWLTPSFENLHPRLQQYLLNKTFSQKSVDGGLLGTIGIEQSFPEVDRLRLEAERLGLLDF